MTKKMNKVIPLVFVLFFLITVTVHAAQPSPQSGTGSYSTTGSGNYLTIGHSLMFGGYTTSVSENDNAVLVSSETSSPMYNSGFEVVKGTGNERLIQGSIYSLTYDGTYVYYNYQIVLKPDNFDPNSAVTGRSLLDNLYQESGVSSADLSTKLTNGGTGWVNSIFSGVYSGGPHTSMYSGRLWSGGSSNYSNPDYAFSTDRILSNFSWSTTSYNAIKAGFDNDVIFPPMPEIDDQPPTHVYDDIDSYKYQNGNEYWTTPGDAVSIQLRGRDPETYLDRSELRLYGSSQDEIAHLVYPSTFYDWTNYESSHVDIQSGSMSYESSGQWEREANFIVVPGTHGHVYSIKVRHKDNGGNNSGWVDTSMNLRVDGVAPSLNASNVYNARYVNGSDYWVRPNDTVNIKVRQYDYHSGNARQYLAITGSNQDERAYHYFNNTYTSIDNFTYFDSSHVKINSLVREENTNYGKINWSVTPYTHGHAYNIKTYLRDNVGNVRGYVDTYKNLRVDGVAPSLSASNVYNARYVNGSDYWVRPNDTVNIKVRQYDPDSGNRRQWLAVVGSNQDERAYMNYDYSSINNMTGFDSAHVKINSFVEEEDTAYYGKVNWSVTPYTHGHSYDLKSYFEDNVANNSGSYVDTGKNLRVDGLAPTHTDTYISSYKYNDGSVYWTTPGDDVNIRFQQYDPHSGNRQQFLRLKENGNLEVRSSHYFGNTSNHNSREVFSSHVSIDAASRDQNTNYGRVNWTVNVKEHGHIYDIQRFYRDLVWNGRGYVSDGRIGVDGAAPVVTVNPSSSDWTNNDVTVDMDITDAHSGVGWGDCKWSQSTTTPTSGWQVSGCSSPMTQSSEGVWYYHYKVSDNVGNVNTGYTGPYKIDKTIPTVYTPSISFARYVNGTDYWYQPGDTLMIRVAGKDDQSRLWQSHLGLYGSDSNVAYHDWGQTDGHVVETDPSIYSNISNGTVYYWGFTGTYDFDVVLADASHGQNFAVKTYHKDNATNESGWIDSGRDIRVDGVAPVIQFRDYQDTVDFHSRDWDLPTIDVRLKFSDGHSGYTQSRYAWTLSTAAPTTWSAWSTSSNYVVSKSTYGSWYLHVQTVDNAGNIRTTYKGPYRYNNAPSSTFKIDKSWYYVGDTMVVTDMSSDPDGNPLTYEYTITKPDGSTVTKTTADFTYKFPDMPGNYNVKQVVTDVHGHSDTASVTVEVRDLYLTGHVKHTPDWQTRHTENGNTPLQFYSGEKFLLEADVTNHPIDQVLVDFSGTQTNGNTYNISNLGLSKSTDILYKGSIDDQTLAEGGTRLTDGFHTFRFTAYYSNGIVRTDNVTIEIIGSVYDAFSFHKKY